MISDGKVIGLSQLSEPKDITTMDPEDAILWLDSFLFSKDGLKPTAEDLSLRFGPSSPTYGLLRKELETLFSAVSDRDEVRLKFKLWTRNMNIVYGREPEVGAFLDQTYLITLVKLIIYLKLSEGDISINSLKNVLSGEYFTSNGIANLIEEDFFSWILDSRIINETLEIAHVLARELSKYNISDIDEDVFKEIYQVIVRQGERHRTGEYYTPEWLSQLTLLEAVKILRRHNKKSTLKILDPACGSGTFLTNAIRFVRSEHEELPKEDLLETVLNNVIGMDINPLAVIIARANYIIALGELLQVGKTITVPVFLSDSIKIPTVKKTLVSKVPVYEIEADGVVLQLPRRVASDRSIPARVLEALRNASNEYRSKRNKQNAMKIFENKVHKILRKEEIKILQITVQTILSLMDKNLNSIWIFMLNNIYAPISLLQAKSTLVIGNPPWIVMRTIENKSYQNFLKEEVLAYGLLKPKQSDLYTQIEMATFFYCRCADLYLKKNGLLAFLMPISVIGAATHHREFQTFKKPRMKLLHILNFENIPDIFSLPVCVLYARNNQNTRYPVTAVRYNGNIRKFRRNEKLDVIKGELATEEYKYSPPTEPEKSEHSYYYDKVKAGGSIYPRPFWFVEFNIKQNLSFDLESPPLISSRKVQDVGKKEWKDVTRSGNVEGEYIFVTLLGKDIIPFGFVAFRPVVLPIQVEQTRLNVLDSDALRNNGKPLIADWVEGNQRIWEVRRTDKSEKTFPRVIDRLNRYNVVTDQDPSKQYVVLYNARGANAMAYVLDRKTIPPIRVGELAKLENRQFVVDITTYYYATNDLNEAHYISAVLNSSIINKKVKPFQPRGKYGKRDIGIRPFMLSIHEFDKKNEDHLQLARISKECHEFITKHKFSKKGFKSMRNEALKLIKDKLSKIDVVKTVVK